MLAIVALVVAAACSSENDESASTTRADGAAPSSAPVTIAVTTTEGTTPPSTETTASTTNSSAPRPTAGGQDPSEPTFVPVLADRVCPSGPASVSCSWIDVPADWDEPDGATIRLPIAVIPAQSSDGRPDVERQPDPIVIPAGGPGFSGSERFGWAFAVHNDARDIVLYDQRGTGRAEPSLDCPEMDAAWVANLQRAEPFDVEVQAIIDAATECRARLEADGIDMNDYDSEASALDLDAIRRALGYDEWNILGISYGARLALAAMRSTPDGIRSVILDSVSDVTGSLGAASTIASAERAYGALASACAADPACAATFGDVEAQIYRLADAWDADPLEIDVDLNDGLGPQRFVITGGDLLAGVFDALYDEGLVPLLPAILAGLEGGDTTAVVELVRAGIGQGTGAAEAMQESVNCADAGGTDPADRAVRDNPGQQRLLAASLLCDEWPVEPSRGFTEPVTSDIPALVLAGFFDPITPPAESEGAANALRNATYLLFPTAAHGVTTPDQPCAESIQLAFLSDPTAPVDASCIDAIPPISFVGAS